jgi:hypothetical protein
MVTKSRNHIEKNFFAHVPIPTDGEPSNRLLFGFHSIIAISGPPIYHCRRNGSNLFQITADAHPGVSGVSKDQKLCEKFENTYCQVDHLAKNE